MVFRLRYLHHDFELPPGRFLIGRSTDCQLSLDDPLVSRKHALLIVSEAGVDVQDLGSRNGVLVNGEKITGQRPVRSGDRVTIGSQDLTVTAPTTDAPTMRSLGHHALSPVTVTAMAPVRADKGAKHPDAERADDESTRADDGTSKRDAFRLLGGVADKALVLGRADEAERLLSTLLEHVLDAARYRGDVDDSLVEQAGFYGARLAGATGKAMWVDYVFELYTLRERPIPGPTIDELHTVLRKVKDVDLASLRGYVRLLRGASAGFGPAERFLVQRIEGLERLVTVQ